MNKNFFHKLIIKNKFRKFFYRTGKTHRIKKSGFTPDAVGICDFKGFTNFYRQRGDKLYFLNLNYILPGHFWDVISKIYAFEVGRRE